MKGISPRFIFYGNVTSAVSSNKNMEAVMLIINDTK